MEKSATGGEKKISKHYFLIIDDMVGKFFISKASESRGKGTFGFVESCFWEKAYVTFEPFGWLLAFAKAG